MLLFAPGFPNDAVWYGGDEQRFEEMYMKECMKSRPNPTAKFNYAWALIRSKDVGLQAFQELCGRSSLRMTSNRNMTLHDFTSVLVHLHFCVTRSGQTLRRAS